MEMLKLLVLLAASVAAVPVPNSVVAPATVVLVPAAPVRTNMKTELTSLEEERAESDEAADIKESAESPAPREPEILPAAIVPVQIPAQSPIIVDGTSPSSSYTIFGIPLNISNLPQLSWPSFLPSLPTLPNLPSFPNIKWPWLSGGSKSSARFLPSGSGGYYVVMRSN